MDITVNMQNINFLKIFNVTTKSFIHMCLHHQCFCMLKPIRCLFLILFDFWCELPSVLVCFLTVSSFSLGAILIPGAALGQILGGVLVSKFKMTCKNTMKFALLTSLIGMMLSFVFVYASCENEPFAGVSVSYNG